MASECDTTKVLDSHAKMNVEVETNQKGSPTMTNISPAHTEILEQMDALDTERRDLVWTRAKQLHDCGYPALGCLQRALEELDPLGIVLTAEQVEDIEAAHAAAVAQQQFDAIFGACPPFTLDTYISEFVVAHAGPKWGPGDDIDWTTEAIVITLESHFDWTLNLQDSELVAEWLTDFGQEWADLDDDDQASEDRPFGRALLVAFESYAEEGPYCWVSGDASNVESLICTVALLGSSFTELAAK